MKDFLILIISGGLILTAVIVFRKYYSKIPPEDKPK